MFELADRLVGIYKTYNCTKSVTLNPKLYGTTGVPAACSQQSQVLYIKALKITDIISQSSTYQIVCISQKEDSSYDKYCK